MVVGIRLKFIFGNFSRLSKLIVWEWNGMNIMGKSKIALARLNSLNTLIFMAFEKYAIRANGVCIFDGQINGIRIESCEFKNAHVFYFSLSLFHSVSGLFVHANSIHLAKWFFHIFLRNVSAFWYLFRRFSSCTESISSNNNIFS